MDHCQSPSNYLSNANGFDSLRQSWNYSKQKKIIVNKKKTVKVLIYEKRLWVILKKKVFFVCLLENL